MVARRAFLKNILPAVFAAATSVANRIVAADPPASGSGLPAGFDLKKQLEKGLKAQRPSDFVYIQKVVAKVENGTLPRTLVEQAFLFARQSDRTYPFIYFQFALNKLAAKVGITL